MKRWGRKMRTKVKEVIAAPGISLEYALAKDRSTARGQINLEQEREKLREMASVLVKQAVQKQLKEQQNYYKSRPSLAARQMERIFGAGSLERVMVPMISSQVYERVEEHIRLERIRKGG